jgi:hypothetical protein
MDHDERSAWRVRHNNRAAAIHIKIKGRLLAIILMVWCVSVSLLALHAWKLVSSLRDFGRAGVWCACIQELVECMAINTEEEAASCAGTSGSRTVMSWVVRMVSELAGVELLLLSCVP